MLMYIMFIYIYYKYIYIKKGGFTVIKYIYRPNNREHSSYYMYIIINRTLYLSCLAGLGFEPSTVVSKGVGSPY